MFSLRGKHAVVTGGGSGIGLAIARALGEAGARLTLVGRDAGKLGAARGELGGMGVEVFPGDLSCVDKIDGYAGELVQQYGGADILVNAAGITKREAAREMSAETWRAIVDTNLSAPFFLARALVPPMLEKGWGRILNIASLQSRLAFDGGIAYGASKGGVAQLTRAMANEWSAGGVNANALAPGFFATQLTQVIFDDAEKSAALAARTAIGRNGELVDLAGAAVFLCAPASDYVTGQILYIDGGFTIR